MTIRLTRSFLWTLAILAAVVVLAAFPVAVGRTSFEAETSADAYRVGFGAGQSLQLGSRIAYSVEGDRWLEPALRPALGPALAGSAAFSDAVALGQLPEKVDSPVVMIEITRTRAVWTPVVALVESGVTASFASDGATAWRRDATVQMAAAADPTIRMRLNMTYRSLSFGLVPWWGHQRRLAERLAERLATDLAAQLGN